MSNNDASANTATVEATTVAAAQAKAQEAQRKALQKVRENAETYPHAMVGKNAEANKIACTLRWDPIKNKYQCQIKCAVMGTIERWVYTSDLFQVNMCEAEAKKAKAAKKTAQKALLKKASALIASGAILPEIKVTAPAAPEIKPETPTVSTEETSDEDEGDGEEKA